MSLASNHAALVRADKLQRIDRSTPKIWAVSLDPPMLPFLQNF